MDTKKLRQKILDLAIRGKLVPQDPNDEPASVLLERIRAEKERLVKEGKIKRSKKSASDDEIEAPNGWGCCRFEEICSKFSTGPFGSMVHKSDYVSQDGTPIVNPMNIVDGKIITNNLMMVSNKKAQELDRYKLTKNDILIARRGDLRKCCIVTENSVNWLCGTGSFFLHAPFVEPQYIEFFYLSEYVQTILKRECVGATMDNLNQSVLGSIPFLLPPLSEQKRIANAVERWFTLIDELESNEGDLLKTIDKAKSKILDLAIHGKLVPQDPNDEPASVLLDKIRKEKAQLVKEGKLKKKDLEETPVSEEEKPFEIPESWEWVRLGDITEIARGGSPRPIKDYLTDDPNGLNWIKIGDTDKGGKYINSCKEKIKPEGLKKTRMVHPGDFLLTNSMSFGRPYITNIEGCIHDGWLMISPYAGVFDQSYLYYVLSSAFAHKQFCDKVAGAVVQNLNSDKVADSIVPLPPLAEQKRIVEKIEEVFKEIDKLKK